MSVRKVYGTLTSPPTLRVLASLYEHELDFDFIPIDINTGEHKTQHFLSLNPFGQIPVFQDGDLTLFESRTIMRYIAFGYPKAGKEHIFKDPLVQGLVAAWIDVEDHHFDPPALNLIDELVFKPPKINDDNVTRDNVVVTIEEAKLAILFDIYEERLTQSKYLGGDKFTSAVLTNTPYLHYFMGTPVKRLVESRPHVRAWCAHILARPAWAQVVKMINKT